MRISYNWLLTYLNINTSSTELAERLTSVGLEVESIEDEGKKFEKFVIGKVLSVEKHPNANKLLLCKVQISVNEQNVKQIVCGARNVAVNQKVIVALPGALVPHDQHDPDGKPFTMTEATIRGEKSFGMICSGKELGLNEDGEGILVLPDAAEVGSSFSNYLGLDDISLEIGITPNRPDCLSHLGIAREVAASYQIKMNLPKLNAMGKQAQKIENTFSVQILNETGCPRYVARLIKNVAIKESPEWMQKFLKAAGIRPINNVVDVTNFVMLEYGQPLHAFDYQFLQGNTICVKNSIAGELFTTLDGKVHTLNGTELMICDANRSIALAGVMGGENSEISLTTQTVLLEAAYFNSTVVRKTAKRLGISSEASYRFERGIDPNITNIASQRAAQLIAEVSGGTIVEEYIDCYPKTIEAKSIHITKERVNKILGTSLDEERIVNLLNSIEILSKKTSKGIECSVPTFRPDIEQEMDIIEEVARLFGYDNIEDKLSSEISFEKLEQSYLTVNSIRSWLEGNGFNEIVTNSLMDVHFAKEYANTLVHVKNPLTLELGVMRPSLLPTMLQAVAHNNNHGINDLRLYELGRVFNTTKENSTEIVVAGYKEKQVIGLVLAGSSCKDSWYEKSKQFDVFSMKGYVESILSYLGLDNIHLIWYDKPKSLSEQTINVEINGTYVGYLGKCNNETLLQYKINQDVYYCELDLHLLLHGSKEKKYKEFSKFPVVTRDLAFVVDQSVHVGDVEVEIRKENKYLTGVTLFDLFEHAALGENKKSIAFTLSFVSQEKTLTDTEIEKEITAIIKRVTVTFNATLRTI